MPASKTTKRDTAAVLLAPRLAQSEETSLVELEKLLTDLGISVVRTIIQRGTPLGSPHLIGTGKLEELKLLVAEQVEQAPPHREIILVVAADITPSEQRALERVIDVPVLDRSAVILRIFGERAQTTLARLEVSLARARYELPRVRDDSDLGGREGGGGRAARGHSNVELKKQQLRGTISDLEQKIASAEKAQRIQQRARKHMSRVALVGYTNAGKSSLMKALCGKDVLVADQLFATLSTTVRTLPGTNPPAVISDTVGFMRALPHELLRSFRSTLMEAVEADLRLVVVDAADPSRDEQLMVTEQVLDDLGAGRDSQILVLNKVDRLTAEESKELRRKYPGAVLISAHSLDSVEHLRCEIASRLDAPARQVQVLVPFSNGKRLSELYEHTRVVRQKEVENGLQLTLRAAPSVLARLGLSGSDDESTTRGLAREPHLQSRE